VREGTPAALKAELSERRGGAAVSLDDVFLDATGRSSDRAAGEVQEVGA
jgi:ABC-2 type transport system ATP-binding protein